MAALFPECFEVQNGSNVVADTTSETTSTVEDMQGFDEITFIVKFADVDAAAVLTFTVKENTASSTSSPTPTAIALTGADVSGAVTATITAGAAVLTESSGNLDDKMVVITVAGSKITKRYVFLSITVADESYEVSSITTIKGKARSLPVTQPTDVASLVTIAS